MHGVYARVNAVRRHYYEVHAWIPSPRVLADAEYNLSSIFFNMDSAIECLTFALNALGSAVAPGDFRDVTDRRSLASINPSHVHGIPTRQPPVPPLAGYGKYFPTLGELWQDSLPLINQIRDQHAVSKHRETIFSGGKFRDDPPPGFYEGLGVADDTVRMIQFQPMAEIILRPDPKRPRVERPLASVKDRLPLETIAEQFCEFMNESAGRALADARATIQLPQPSFKEPEDGRGDSA